MTRTEEAEVKKLATNADLRKAWWDTGRSITGGTDGPRFRGIPMNLSDDHAGSELRPGDRCKVIVWRTATVKAVSGGMVTVVPDRVPEGYSMAPDWVLDTADHDVTIYREGAPDQA